jgi:adenosylcobinamide kinase/adenosylcobinamide-phosphate guanylyltransferase
MLTLILGAARSGKSKLAQQFAESYRRVTCIATSPATEDPEMAARIELHRASRPAAWQTIEVPLALAEAIECTATGADAILVDCLTLWLSNLFLAGNEATAHGELKRIAAAAHNTRIILVSNELGAGTVPDHALTRHFRDAHGIMNQHAAELADEVILTIAGLPLHLKAPK